MVPLFENFKVYDLAGDIKITPGAGDDKQILLIVQSEDRLSDELKQFLAKIVQAVDRNLDQDFWMLTISEATKLSFVDLVKDHNIQQTIVFGVQPGQLGININAPLYKPIHLSTNEFLFADDLQLIFEERQRGEKKMAGLLWQGLKMFFGK